MDSFALTHKHIETPKHIQAGVVTQAHIGTWHPSDKGDGFVLQF
ncbi:hypothetical protein [Leisingera sp.]|nr:hypothetical protein [Leisingera sp.]